MLFLSLPVDEYDKSTVALGFIQAALDVTLQLNDPDDVLPILCEAAGKTMELYLLIKSISPVEVTA